MKIDAQAVSSPEKHQMKVLENASLVSSEDEQQKGQLVRRSLYDTDFKYSLILVKETFQQQASGEELVNRVAE